ncbi:hypothetical protein HN695_02925 [Candidatus Woesearchaeota archaeon]|jgi:protein-arginine kinase activator protein McsA|nr:hypothetical protein [Candidatus Woesearchaeota archaeon]MBT5272144.1 hypothetical protein [Candidatus Woesearchaeota archaeon]MBT6040947.1 hypothetical protein [Candidatus Woesearchaeota archaeon]MBT6336281.1 hypothetical protein [Candidatus Woesearchaeota archaeon]MBT7927264.1 hypothetical protein [Candidatus Woesearchaeota archaeon]
MFWKKEEIKEDIICRGCGTAIIEGNAVLDTKTGSFVCKDCHNLGYETNKLAGTGENSDEEDNQEKEETNNEVKEKPKQETTREKMKCKSCGFTFSFTKEKGHPSHCSYCGEKIMK